MRGARRTDLSRERKQDAGECERRLKDRAPRWWVEAQARTAPARHLGERGTVSRGPLLARRSPVVRYMVYSRELRNVGKMYTYHRYRYDNRRICELPIFNLLNSAFSNFYKRNSERDKGGEERKNIKRVTRARTVITAGPRARRNALALQEQKASSQAEWSSDITVIGVAF